MHASQCRLQLYRRGGVKGWLLLALLSNMDVDARAEGEVGLMDLCV